MGIKKGKIAVRAVAGIAFIRRRRVGSTPRGQRLERVKKSGSNYGGKCQNIHKTQQITSKKGFWGTMNDFLFGKKDRSRPQGEIPTVKTNLWELDRGDDILVWFGHSSYLLQVDGKRILVDPVLKGAGSPVSFINRPFPVT